LGARRLRFQRRSSSAAASSLRSDAASSCIAARAGTVRRSSARRFAPRLRRRPLVERPAPLVELVETTRRSSPTPLVEPYSAGRACRDHPASPVERAIPLVELVETTSAHNLRSPGCAAK